MWGNFWRRSKPHSSVLEHEAITGARVVVGEDGQDPRVNDM